MKLNDIKISNEILYRIRRSFPGMTTKLEHSINPLTRAPHNNFAVNTLIIPEGGLVRLKSPSMDRVLESQKIESMRKMMLMQEQVFKLQVHELHRLYNLQKKLMQEIEDGLKLRKETADTAIRHQATTESMQSFKARNDQIEVSGSNSAENSRMPMKFDLEMPAETESTPSSSMHPFEEQNGLKNMDEEGDVEVELTLSIGHCTTKQRSKTHLHDQPQELASSSTKGDAYAHPNSINLTSSTVYQENTRPHWLMHDQSLNRT